MLFASIATGSAWAGDSIDIDRANWSDKRDRLTVRGDNAPDNATVTIRYGEKDDAGAVIGTTTADGDGDWTFRITNPDPVPCNVTAQAGGDDDDKEVRRAQKNCSNKGGVVVPPPVAECNITVSSTTLAFGDVTEGNSVTQNTSVRNSGDAVCDVTIVLSGSNDFAVNGNTSFSIAPGGSQTVSVSYTPGEAGPDNATLVINNNEPNTANISSDVLRAASISSTEPNTTAINLALTGNGLQQQAQECNISVSPTTLALGDVTVGSSTTLSATVSNSGDADCNVILAQGGSSDFDVTNGSFNVVPGGSQTVSVSYAPGEAGADNGTLAVSSNDPDSSTVNVALTGNGLQQQVLECNISVSPTTLALGDVTVGSSTTLSTTVSNSGDADCNVVLAQGGSNDFNLSNGSFSVAAGGSQTVSVSYAPGEAGADNGTLTVSSNDPDSSTVNVALTGNGLQQQALECNISISQTTLNFGDVTVNDSVSQSTTLNNSGDANCDVILDNNGSSDFVITSATNFSVAPGGSRNVSVSYNPSAAGSVNGSLVVNSNDPNAQDNVALSGNGIDNTVACVVTPGDGPQTHADCITSYTGPEVCVECHEDQARDMHGSVHYQQGGAFPNTTNIPSNFDSAGERPAQAAGDLVATGINTYCGTHENSPRFTCAGCHVGNGRFPMAQSEFELMDPASAEAHDQLANIDCLICHQDTYKRFPDWTANGEGFTELTLMNMAEENGELVRRDGAEVVRSGFAGIPNVDPDTLDFQFLPAGIDTLPDTVPMEPMALTTLEAAQMVHSTTRKSCLTCHAGAGGGDGTKRGDLAKENANPSVAIDMHMSPAGENLTCADCHNETLPDGTGHRVRGRGLDLRPNDVPDRFTCENSGCHTDRPHDDFNNTRPDSRDRHATKVACQTCHIPSYAKAAVGTEVARDWQDPHPSAAACNGRGGWLPREDKGGLGSASLTPSYAWFDGTSEIYYLGEALDGVPTIPLDASVAASFVGDFNAGDPAYVIGMPNGDVASTNLNTKLYPMKEHWGKIARNDQDNTLIGHSTFEFFRTGSFCRAVAVGLGLDEVNDPSSSVCNGLPGDLEMPQNTTAVAVHTYQTINHGVETTGNALDCNDCHGSTARMDLQGDLGYALKGPESQVCTQCHGSEDSMSFNGVHDRHVEREGKDCSVCHTFSRPERGLSTRLN